MKKSLTLWSIILVLTGTYFRSKSGQDVETKEIDFLIITQLLVAFVGGIVGAVIVARERKFGPSSIVMLAFVFFAGTSALLTPLSSKVLGYWILLLGSTLLTLAMIQKSNNPADLELVEKTWLSLIILIVFKDSLISLFIPGLANEWSADRLGMGVIHANTIGFYAAIAFWMLHRQHQYLFPMFKWVVRVFLIIVILLAKSRISMITFFIGGFVVMYFNYSQDEDTYLLKRLFALAIAALFIFTFALFYFFDVAFVQNIFTDFNRGQNVYDLVTLTGRTDIWRLAFMYILDGPINFLFGHGYGVSSFLLNNSTLSPTWYIYHSHNDFIEVLLNVGIVGFVLFLFLMIRSFSWLFRFRKLIELFSQQFVTRAAAVVSMIFFYSITEVNFGSKVDPILLISLFYLLSLDLTKNLQKTAESGERT